MLQLPLQYPQFEDVADYCSMSGTSQAAAVTSGVVALMLQDDPTLTPDDVKCKLMDSSHAAVDSAGNLAYSPLQQGAGLIDAAGAIAATRSGCANLGLDLAKDLCLEIGKGPMPRDLRRMILGPGLVGEEIGSNNWVVSGRFTQSGFPYIVNDPHRTQSSPSRSNSTSSLALSDEVSAPLSTLAR